MSVFSLHVNLFVYNNNIHINILKCRGNFVIYHGITWLITSHIIEISIISLSVDSDGLFTSDKRLFAKRRLSDVKVDDDASVVMGRLLLAPFRRLKHQEQKTS